MERGTFIKGNLGLYMVQSIWNLVAKWLSFNFSIYKRLNVISVEFCFYFAIILNVNVFKSNVRLCFSP